ncbi:MAG: YpdA family putative bacillithiol disulfide reductase [Chitinophagaceae bacterium]
MSQTKIPLIIIGAGPIGLACAIEAKKAGIEYLILEKGNLVNSLFNYPANMTFFSTSERLEIGGIPFVSIHPKPTRPEALEYYRRVKLAYDLRVNLYEEVTEVRNLRSGDGPTAFTVITGKAVYRCSKIIVCTGFYDLPYLLDVPGENLPKVTHYYKEPHPYAFQKVIVIGSQNSSVDAALETWRKGAEVTMVIRKPGIGERVKYWVRPDILNRIEEGSIRALYNSSVTAIRDGEVDVQTPDGLITIPNDWVIATTGYQPDLAFLKKMGINLSDDEVFCPYINEQTHETNVRGIYLAGVICGGMNTHRLFIENSRVHATTILSHIKEEYFNNDPSFIH